MEARGKFDACAVRLRPFFGSDVLNRRRRQKEQLTRWASAEVSDVIAQAVAKPRHHWLVEPPPRQVPVRIGQATQGTWGVGKSCTRNGWKVSTLSSHVAA